MNLYYVHDPMCSWCWAFRPVWHRLIEKLPAAILIRRVLGGLAPDSTVPMPEATRAYVMANWRRIQEVVPGIQFNYEFWTRCQPRRATYPACRAVIAAMAQGPDKEAPMITAIQHAYYLQARNPSDTDTLIELATELGLDPQRFSADLASPGTHEALLQQLQLARQLGAQGFPSLILETGQQHRSLQLDYTDESFMLQQIQRAVAESAGQAPA